MRLHGLLLLCLLAGFAGRAGAEDIVVSNYGVSANGMPYAVALEKGFFKQEGADVSGIVTSAGGGTTLRNMLASSSPYAEINPNAVIAAIQQGADIKIVSDNVLTVAEFVWGVKPDSPIHGVADLKGKKIGYTQPRSTSQALATLVLQSAGLKTDGCGAGADRRVWRGDRGAGYRGGGCDADPGAAVVEVRGRSIARLRGRARSCRRSPMWWAFR